MFEQPNYMSNGYMDFGEQIASGEPSGAIQHPNTRTQSKPQVIRDSYDVLQAVHSPKSDTIIPYAERANISPYSMNYVEPQGNGYAGLFDETFSAKATPFKTALATSAFLLIGAAAGYSIEAVADKYWQRYSRSKAMKGYGALYGAIVANAVRMSLASGISSGVKPAMTAMLGGLLPVSALFGLQALDPKAAVKSNKAKIALGMAGLAFIAVPLTITLKNKGDS
jgi:hypothetical protein